MTPLSIPLFPLPLVLLPGVTIPLHIFEIRYRRMLADCIASDRKFGIVYLPSGLDEKAIEAGYVGTIGRIEAVVPLADGRSNIVIVGTERFAFRGFLDAGALYHVAQITGYDDEDEDPAAVNAACSEVRNQFARVAAAARLLAGDDSEPPTLPDDPALLAFFIASLIDLDASARQQLLSLRSPLSRLVRIEALLSAAVEPLEQRAMVHSSAKQNGHGPRVVS
ncbi:MAG: LON peptidase substrate-binding domain-containing protein [Anaerolineae bacterium]|nr:LON peptidase substrate-binding domain-containing protein [Gemmatimonadaceae bacterium]